MKPFLRLSYRATRGRSSSSSTQLYRGLFLPLRQQRNYSIEEDEMGKDKEKVNYQLKVPKGTKDWEGRDMVIRDKIFGTITEVFKRHGAVTIDT